MVWPSKKKEEVKDVKEEEKTEETPTETTDKILEEQPVEALSEVLVRICDPNGVEVEARHIRDAGEIESLLLSPEDEVTSRADESGNMIYTIKRR